MENAIDKRKRKKIPVNEFQTTRKYAVVYAEAWDGGGMARESLMKAWADAVD